MFTEILNSELGYRCQSQSRHTHQIRRSQTQRRRIKTESNAVMQYDTVYIGKRWPVAKSRTYSDLILITTLSHRRQAANVVLVLM